MQYSLDIQNDLHHMSSKRRLEEVDVLCQQTLAPIQGRCIELGAGGGYFSQAISRLPQVTAVIALDSSQEMIDTYRAVYAPLTQPIEDKIRYVVDDMNTFGQKYGTFDTVIYCASFHHSPDQVQSLKQAYSILRPGGSLILHGEHYLPVWGSPKRQQAGTVCTIPQFRRLLKAAGFEPIVFRYAFRGQHHPLLKSMLCTWPLFRLVNGYYRLSSFMMLGRKPLTL